jgi:hypothetical protein
MTEARARPAGSFVVLVLAVQAAALRADRGLAAAPAGRFRVVYVQPRTADEQALVGLIKASQLGNVADGLSS